MDINTIINTREEAEQFAIDWQQWVAEQNQTDEEPTLYQSDLLEWQNVFEELAERFDLVDEFQENGII